MRLVSSQVIHMITRRTMTTNIREPVFYQGNGNPLNKESFFAKIESNLNIKPKHILLLGENHSDPSAHQLELEILTRVAALKPGETALSLEFFDRSAQAVLDEYLLDFIDYDTFIENCQAPANHKDYRPLIEFCKARKLPVIAANCSRRHSRLMSRQGPDAMEKLAEESELHRNFLLPPLPIQAASRQYEANFRATMGIVGSEGLDDHKITRMLGNCPFKSSIFSLNFFHVLLCRCSKPLGRHNGSQYHQVSLQIKSSHPRSWVFPREAQLGYTRAFGSLLHRYRLWTHHCCYAT